LEAIKNWQPNYSKVVCVLKTAFNKMIYSQNGALLFLPTRDYPFLKDS